MSAAERAVMTAAKKAATLAVKDAKAKEKADLAENRALSKEGYYDQVGAFFFGSFIKCLFFIFLCYLYLTLLLSIQS